jgi:hypothetical protein
MGESHPWILHFTFSAVPTSHFSRNLILKFENMRTSHLTSQDRS